MLASINKIETAFGTNLNVSTAGAVGWMQFIPSSWQAYGVDATAMAEGPVQPGRRDLRRGALSEGGRRRHDLRRAIFAYNHAGWYVDEVMMYARQYGELP